MSTFVRLVLVYCLGVVSSASAATFQFRFVDDPGVGFNDPTPIAPSQRGNNPGTTLGEARRNVLIEAGRIWGALLVSNVPIIVQVRFEALTCAANTGTLASAGAQTFFRDFLDAPTSPDTFFASALADSLAGEDLMQQDPVPERRNRPDIVARFNLNVDADPACLNGAGFYYGFDHSSTRIDLLVVALHELAHGFGFSSEIDTETGMTQFGATNAGRFSTYVMQIFDESLGRSWPMLSDQERAQSAVRSGFVAWNGSNVNAQAGMFTAGVTAAPGRRVRLFAPAPADDGSSISHFDRAVSPNVLMEPNISASLRTSTVDITVCALRDIGWQTTRCPDLAAARGAQQPTATSKTITVIEDTPTAITLDGFDPENESLGFGFPMLPTKGTISGGATAARTFTPLANANGADSFTFTASDGVNTSLPATISINITAVNDVPVANNLALSTVTAQAANITLLGSDADGDAVTFELVTNPASGSVTGSGAARTYQSNPGFVGTDSFTYRVRDAVSASPAATVTITVASASGSPTPTPTPTPSPGDTPVPGGGGGGAMGELLLAALGALAIAARRRRVVR